MSVRFYACPQCERLLVTMSDGSSTEHDCTDKDTRAQNIAVLHSEGNHSRCQPNC